MNQDILTLLYLACSLERVDWPYAAEGMNLGELYQRLPEVSELGHKFSDVLQEAQSKEDLNQLDWLCCKLNIANEKQGFINGFRMAVKLILSTR